MRIISIFIFLLLAGCQTSVTKDTELNPATHQMSYNH